MRVLARPLLALRDLDHAQHLDRPGQGGGARETLMEPQRLADLRADRQDRIERRHRLLEDHRDLVAAHKPHRLVVETQQVAAAERHGTADDAAGWLRDQAHDGERRHALAAAGFADDGERLAAAQRERHVVHRLDDALAGEEEGPQPLDREDDVGVCRRGHPSRCRGSRMSRTASPSRLVPNTTRLIARRAELRRRQHDQRRQRVGQDMPDGDAPLAHADRLRRLDEGQLAQGERVAADDARDIGNQRDGDGDDGVLERGTERRRHHQGENQQRQGLEDIYDALGDEIAPSPEIAGGQADDDADHRAEQRRADADSERDAGAVDDAAIDVAAEGIGAQPMRGAGRRQGQRRVDRQRIVGRDEVREERGEDEERHDRRPDGAQRVATREEERRAPASLDSGAGPGQLDLVILDMHVAPNPRI